MIQQLALAWSLTRGYRLAPWRSPYLRWRIETYSGLHGDEITPREFLRFCWTNRKELRRYLDWAAKQKR